MRNVFFIVFNFVFIVVFKFLVMLIRLVVILLSFLVGCDGWVVRMFRVFVLRVCNFFFLDLMRGSSFFECGVRNVKIILDENEVRLINE